jgi:hypothetical protein
MTPSGNDPATFRFEEQCLKHCATAFPLVRYSKYPNEFSIKKSENQSVVLNYGLTKTCAVFICKNGTNLSQNLAQSQKYCDNQVVFE